MPLALRAHSCHAYLCRDRQATVMRYRNKTTNEDFHTGAKAFVRDFGLTGTLPSRSIQEHKMATPCGNLRRLVQIYLDITTRFTITSRLAFPCRLPIPATCTVHTPPVACPWSHIVYESLSNINLKQQQMWEGKPNTDHLKLKCLVDRGFRLVGERHVERNLDTDTLRH